MIIKFNSFLILEARKSDTAEDFIEKAKKVHGDKYDYSLVDYKKSTEKVKIICNKHGIFEKVPAIHLTGQGCPSCSVENSKILRSSNTEDFIEDSKKVHGNKYDYSLVDYKNSKLKVKIICTKHGIFEQTPNSHISQKQGCPKCSGNFMDQNYFIEKAKKIHSDTYDYSLVDYKHTEKKVKIICNKHGIFEQTPHSHLNGQGCPICNGGIKSNTEDFIEKAKNIHGDTYDYSLVDYKNNDKKVKIICNKSEHGIFKQTPHSHLNGRGCPKCSGNFMDQNYFIEKAKKIHGDTYDYSLVDYKNSNKKVEIICTKPRHGIFKQTPNMHLSGQGCPICGGTGKLNTEDFIERSKIVHGDKYDYSLVNYKNNIKKVEIICTKPRHGIFTQTPNSHLSGKGCPICQESKGEIKVRNILNDYNIKYDSQKRFESIRKYAFDFYLPNYNICIEYDGRQHYEEISYFHRGKNTLEYSQKIDAIKTKFCLDNKIPLIRIPYTVKDIEEYLMSKIKTIIDGEYDYENGFSSE